MYVLAGERDALPGAVRKLHRQPQSEVLTPLAVQSSTDKRTALQHAAALACVPLNVHARRPSTHLSAIPAHSLTHAHAAHDTHNTCNTRQISSTWFEPPTWLLGVLVSAIWPVYADAIAAALQQPLKCMPLAPPPSPGCLVCLLYLQLGPQCWASACTALGAAAAVLGFCIYWAE